jgi:hypothetical protein
METSRPYTLKFHVFEKYQVKLTAKNKLASKVAQ